MTSMSYLILVSALLLEVIATSLLKYSDGFKNFTFGIFAYCLYGISIYLFSISLKYIKLAVADTIWQGLGIVLICLTSLFVFHEPITMTQYLFIFITMIGVIGLGLVS